MTDESRSARERSRALEVKRRLYAKEAPTYDREADFVERWLFGTECASPESTSAPTCSPSVHVMRTDFDIQARDRLRAGIIERLVAVKPR